MGGPLKLVVVGLVAVVALYVAAVGLGAGAGEGDPGAEDQPGLPGLLLDRFAGQADVELGELSAPCLQPDRTLQISGSCALRVTPSEKQLRLVRMRVSGSAVRVTAPPPHEDADIDSSTSTFSPGEEVEVAVGPDGAAIGLQCSGLGSCALSLEVRR